jgi:hypothetical protein
MKFPPNAAKLVAGSLLLTSAFILLMKDGGDVVPAPPVQQDPHPKHEKLQASSKSERAAAQTLAEQRLKRSKELSERLKNIRLEISKSTNPSAIFKELHDLIASTEDPTIRSILTSEIANGMLTFENPSEGVEWIKRYDHLLRNNFSTIPSGGGSTVYRSMCSIYARKAIGKEQEKEVLTEIRKTPANQIISSTLLPTMSEMISYSGNFSELDSFNSIQVKEASLGYILENHNPAEKTSGIERYLKPEFSSFSDPNSKIIRKFATPAWYATNVGEIDSILSESTPGPSKNRFLAVLAELAAKSGDGREFTFLDQIDDSETRNRIEREISVITAGSERK